MAPPSPKPDPQASPVVITRPKTGTPVTGIVLLTWERRSGANPPPGSQVRIRASIDGGSSYETITTRTKDGPSEWTNDDQSELIRLPNRKGNLLLRIEARDGSVLGESGVLKLSEQMRSVILLRHAEKETDSSHDSVPLKKPVGEESAANLARLLASTDLGAAIATTAIRTHATAKPTAELFGLEVARPERSAVPAELEKLQPGSRTLVVSHSRWVPRLARETLKAPWVDWSDEIPPRVYDRVWVINEPSDGPSTTLRLRFDPTGIAFEALE